MIVHVFESRDQVARAAAAIFAAQILKKPNSILGLATGSTPIDTYAELVKMYKAGILDFSKVKTFNLDEYVGLPVSHPESYISFMRRNLFDHINLKEYHLPNGLARDLKQECLDYEDAIRQAGGIDLQLLGIGTNGHIGFNEPNDHFVYSTNRVQLTESTIKANRRFFESEDQVPREALSMGIGTIMQAKSILMICMGESKADVVEKMINGPVDPKVPASILRTHHHVTVLLDKEAAGRL